MIASRKIKENLQEEIIDFLDLCDRLSKATDRANENILMDNPLMDNRMALKRVVMLKEFERETSKIFKMFQGDLADDLSLQNYLIDVVKTLQDKLKINTGLHLYMIAANSDFGVNEGAKCH